MRTYIHDLRLTFRQLRRSPGFTLTAVWMLAFGIGATTAIFSVVYGVLLRPLPFPNADRLVTLGDQLNGQDWGKQDPGWVTGPEVVVYPRDTRSFENLAGTSTSNMSFQELLGYCRWDGRSGRVTSPCGSLRCRPKRSRLETIRPAARLHQLQSQIQTRRWPVPFRSAAQPLRTSVLEATGVPRRDHRSL